MRLLLHLIALSCLLAPCAALAGEPEPPAPTSKNRFVVMADLLTPLEGYGSSRVGFGGSFSEWIEFDSAALQPRLFCHYGPGSNDAYYLEFAAELGAAWLPFHGTVTPEVGGGFGLHYLRVRGETHNETEGNVLTITSKTYSADSNLGVGGYLRAGALFFRDSPVNVSVHLDYSLAFLGGGHPQALVFAVGIGF